MENEKIKKLLEKYFEGSSSIDDERFLKNYFKQAEIAEEFEEYRNQFKFLMVMKQERSESAHEILFDKIQDQKIRKVTFNWQWMYNVAAGLTILIIGFGAGKWYSNAKDSSQPELTALQSDVAEMKKMLAINSMQQTSASERIMAVNKSTSISEANIEIIEALLSTLNSDANVNVRLAACEALFHWKENEMVRNGLIGALSNQKDPGIQITIINMLVTMKERGAIPEIQKLIQSQDVLKVVKSNAEQGIARLL